MLPITRATYMISSESFFWTRNFFNFVLIPISATSSNFPSASGECRQQGYDIIAISGNLLLLGRSQTSTFGHTGSNFSGHCKRVKHAQQARNEHTGISWGGCVITGPLQGCVTTGYVIIRTFDTYKPSQYFLKHTRRLIVWNYLSKLSNTLFVSCLHYGTSTIHIHYILDSFILNSTVDYIGEWSFSLYYLYWLKGHHSNIQD